MRWYPSGGTVGPQPPRHVYKMAKEFNRRTENIALDQKLRTGKEVRPRRSDFSDWYVISVINALNFCAEYQLLGI